METKKVMWAEKISRAYGARQRCQEHGREQWFENWSKTVEHCLQDLPTGGGFSNWVMLAKSTPEKLIFESSYHAMLDNGMYDRWINFTITITPSFETRVNIGIRGDFGRAYQDLKDYIGDTLQPIVTNPVDEYDDYQHILSALTLKVEKDCHETI
jgi:hypothetical protein